MTTPKSAIERTKYLAHHLCDESDFNHSVRGRDSFALLQTMLIVNALDRLTAAVKSVDDTLDNASLPDCHPRKR